MRLDELKGKRRPQEMSKRKEDWVRKLFDRSIDLINNGQGDTLVAESDDGKEKLTAWEWVRKVGGSVNLTIGDRSIKLPSEVIEKLVRMGFRIGAPHDLQEILKHVPEKHRKDFLEGMSKGMSDPTAYTMEDVEKALGLDQYRKEMN